MNAPAAPSAPLSAIARHVWQSRYRFGNGTAGEATPIDSFRRVATAVAAAEGAQAPQWAARFLDILADGRFLPGGRILAGAGTGRRVTLFNCFVLGPIEDSLDGIFTSLHEGALTMQEGGGAGWDFSTLRPRGVRAQATGGVASGPVSFMRLWDRMCETLETANDRRGAMMATLRCDHPDVLAFIEAKRAGGGLSNFNLSVQITDEFMAAVRAGGEHALVFPEAALGNSAETADVVLARLRRRWPGQRDEVSCRVFARVPARELWQRLLGCAGQSGEPGFLFVDRINRGNNLWYRENISATNPCGEEPLPPYGACNLGSLNLTAFVRDPFASGAQLDLEGLADAARIAVRFLDDVIDVSHFPLPAQAEAARTTRRLGLGITGLADALCMLGLPYDSPAARTVAAHAAEIVAHAAYRTSTELAREKGPCPAFSAEHYLAGPFIAALPLDLREIIARDGVRNSHLLAIAPAGSISLLAGNVSSGIEPIFRARTKRALRGVGAPDDLDTFEVIDHAVSLWQAKHGQDAGLPPAFVDAEGVAPEAHLDMQIALQPFVDSAISKTIQLPPGYEPAALGRLADRAYDGGLKGFTVFPRGSHLGEVLLSDPPEACDAPACEMPG